MFNKKDRKGKQRSAFGTTSNLSEWLVRGFAFRPIVVPLSFPWLASIPPMRPDGLAKVTGGPVGKQITSYNEFPLPRKAKLSGKVFFASILPVQYPDSK